MVDRFGYHRRCEGSDQLTINIGTVTGGTIDDTGSGVDDIDVFTVIGTAASNSLSVYTDGVALGTKVIEYTGNEVLRVTGMGGNDTFSVYDTSAGTLILDGNVGSDTFDIYTGVSANEIYIHDTGPYPSQEPTGIN